MLDIYLDVDGVLRNCASPQADIEAFLHYCLEHYPLYWLTSFCRGGVNHAPHALRGHLPDTLVDELEAKVNVTDWQTSKVEAIDFDTPFIWFDDSTSPYILDKLKRYDAKDSFYLVDPYNPNAAKEMLSFLQGLAKN